MPPQSFDDLASAAERRIQAAVGVVAPESRVHKETEPDASGRHDPAVRLEGDQPEPRGGAAITKAQIQAAIRDVANGSWSSQDFAVKLKWQYCPCH